MITLPNRTGGRNVEVVGGRPGSLMTSPARGTRFEEKMELLLLAAALVIVALTATGVHRHQQAAAWDRELDQAFGTNTKRDLPRHRTL